MQPCWVGSMGCKLAFGHNPSLPGALRQTHPALLYTVPASPGDSCSFKNLNVRPDYYIKYYYIKYYYIKDYIITSNITSLAEHRRLSLKLSLPGGRQVCLGTLAVSKVKDDWHMWGKHAPLTFVFHSVRGAPNFFRLSLRD